MVSSTTYLKISIKASKSGLKEAMLKDNWRGKLVTLMIYPVVLMCCCCFLEHVLVSVLFLAHTSQSGSGKEHRGHWCCLPAHPGAHGTELCPAGSGTSPGREAPHALWAVPVLGHCAVRKFCLMCRWNFLGISF